MRLLRRALQSPFLSVVLVVPCIYIVYFVGMNLVVASSLYRPAYAFVGMSKAIVICHKSTCSCSNETLPLVDQSVKLALPVVVLCEKRDAQIQSIEQTFSQQKVRVIVTDNSFVTAKFSTTGKVMTSLVHYGKIVRQIPGDALITADFARETGEGNP